MDMPGKQELIIYRDTNVDRLADLLLENSGRELCGGSLFHKLPVIVPNKSTARYLTLRYARKFGIAAGIDFPFLMSLFQRSRFRKTEGTVSLPEAEEEEITPAAIGWRICKVLPDLLKQKQFAAVAAWMKGDTPIRRLRFGREMGRLYDRYMLYRPEWINEWERQPSGTGGWQAELWRAVSNGLWAGRHFAALYEEILSGKLIPREKGTVRIFGFSAIPPRVLECLENISRHRRVELYHFVPSRIFIDTAKPEKEELQEIVKLYLAPNGEMSSEQLENLEQYYFQHHPLTAAFAAQTRNLLIGTANWEEAEIESATPEEDTLLHRLQKKIMEDDKPPGTWTGGPCRSIQFRNCCSPFRETETAHNFLLHCFEEIPGLTLNDVLIMTPDPDRFAPIVSAVFNHSGDGRLPVSLADRNPAEEQPAFHTLLKVLQLYRGHFTMSDIFTILQDRLVQKNLGITQNECQFCRDRAEAAGIRWGWDAPEHSRLGGVEFKEAAWQTGFDRLLLGWAVDSDPAEPHRLNGETVFPTPGFSGGTGLLLGKFAMFVKKLHEVTELMRLRQTEGIPFQEWKQWLIGLSEELFGQNSSLTVPFLQELRKWEKDLTAADAEDLRLNSEILLELLTGLTGKAADSTKGFLRGRITFCGLRPMRNIPAKVIVLLGMDHDAFPTQETRPEFDRLRKKPEAGDPNLREDERQLFLDLILCAGERLYISYTGRNLHDSHKKYPPSICAEELRAYLSETFGQKSFVDLEEPIQAFSAELFQAGAPNQSYSGPLLAAAKKATAPQGERGKMLPCFAPGPAELPDDPEFYRITPDDLIRFFQNPAEFYLTRRLRAGVKVKTLTNPDDFEAFGNNYLEWDEKMRLLERCIQASEEEKEELKTNSIARFKADSILPLCLKTKWEFWDQINGIARDIPKERPARESKTVDLQLSGGQTVTLLIQNIRTDSGGVQYIPCFDTKQMPNARINGIIMHLAANLTGPTETRIKLPKQTHTAEPMTRETAEAGMKTILELYLNGLCGPLPFFPKTSRAAYEANISGEQPEEMKTAGKPTGGLKTIKTAWELEQSKFVSVFGEELPDPEKITGIAEKFFGTVIFVKKTAGKETAAGRQKRSRK